MKRIVSMLAALLTIFLLASPAAAAYEVNVSVEPEDAGTVTGGGTYQDGQNATLTAIPAAGYSFVGWYSSGNMEAPVSTEAEYEYDLEADRTFVAVFTRKYAVNTESMPSEGGSTSGAGQYSTGEDVTLTAQASPGYIFTGWFQTGSTDPVSTQAVFTFTIGEEDVSYIAQYSINYTLSIDATPVEGGTVTGADEYAGGTVVHVEATPSEDYRFSGWYDASAPSVALSKDRSWSFNLDSNRSLIAKFDRSYGYIFSRILIIVGICAAVAFAAFILIKRNMIIKRRNARRYRRPSGNPRPRPPEDR